MNRNQKNKKNMIKIIYNFIMKKVFNLEEEVFIALTQIDVSMRF